MTKRKMVLIGAGSASFTVGLVADLLASGIEADWTIGLVDISEEALEIARNLVARMIEKRGAPVAFEASTDRRDILPGADIVTTTIAVGGRKAWEDDILVPRKHGLFQPVGDTTGAGGISRGLRQIPPMIAIAEDVHRLCPEAYFFNYGNPMGAICRAVNKATQARVVGLCHGVQGTLRYLCGLIDVPYGEISALYLGMNHLTWITHLTLHGEDLWPRIDAKLPDLPPTENPFSWELYRSYGAFPAVLDRHVVEFFSERFARGEYYGKTLGVNEMDILGVIEGGNANFERMARYARGDEALPDNLFDRVLGEHEALIAIVASILADTHEVFPMNVPNSTVDGIPRDFVLEMPVIATKAGCVPMGLPPMSPAILAWTTEACYGVELAVNAAIAGDRDLVVQALLYDRCVLDLKSAQALADDLIAAQKQHLPQFA